MLVKSDVKGPLCSGVLGGMNMLSDRFLMKLHYINLEF